MGAAIAYNLIKRDKNLRILLVERDADYEYSSTTRSDGNIRSHLLDLRGIRLVPVQ